MKNILVATDFSTTAVAALRQAVALAAMTKGKITLMHVIYADKLNETLFGLDAMEYLADAADFKTPYSPEQGITRLRRAGEEKLAAAIAAIPEPHAAIDPVVGEGRPSVAIVNYATQRGVDLVVVGTNGRGSIGKAFLGSVADNVIRMAECPVMVVRK